MTLAELFDSWWTELCLLKDEIDNGDFIGEAKLMKATGRLEQLEKMIKQLDQVDSAKQFKRFLP